MKLYNRREVEIEKDESSRIVGAKRNHQLTTKQACSFCAPGVLGPIRQLVDWGFPGRRDNLKNPPFSHLNLHTLFALQSFAESSILMPTPESYPV